MPSRSMLRHALTVVGAAAALAAPMPTGAQTKTTRPLALTDYYAVESVGDTAISPDGRQVAFVRTVIVEAEDRRQRQIWLAATDGSGAPRALTDPMFETTGPRWSGDGSLLGYRSSRSGNGSDIWFIRMDGADEIPFQIEGVDGAPVFSPDNQWIAYTHAEPAAQAQAPASELERQIAQRFTGRIYDWMNYRFNGRGYLDDPRDPRATPAEELYIVPRDGGRPRQLTDAGIDVRSMAWRGDSRALAFVADEHQRDEDNYGRADLWTVTIDGRLARVTNDTQMYKSPSWSPDGEFLVVTRQAGLNEVIDTHRADMTPPEAPQTDPVTVERPERAKRRRPRKQPPDGPPVDLVILRADGAGFARMLTGRWELIPANPRWSPDGDAILFTAATAGDSHLFLVPTAGGSVEQVTGGARRLGAVSFDAEFSRVAFSVADSAHPSEIYTAAIDGSSERRLSGFNDRLTGEVGFREAERISFPSADGTEIEGWILTPPGYDPAGSYPLILAIHGGPHSAYGNSFSFQFQLWAADGHVVVYTNPRGSTGYGEEFLWATWGGWGRLDTDDVLAGVDYAVEHYAVDERRMGVTGYSYGGFLTNWIIGHSDRFAAAVTGAGISNWISDYGTADIARTKESEFFGTPWEPLGRELLLELSPIIYAGQITTPTLFVHGEADHRVPIAEGEQMYLALKKNDVDATFIRYPDMAHGGWTPWNTVHRYHHEQQWWARYLKD